KGASCDFTGQSPTNVSTNSQAKSGLADATFCWKVRAVDAHGNASAYSSTFEFTVDTTPPDVPDLSTPTDGSTIGTDSPTLQWSDESTSGATNYDVLFVTKGASCDFTGQSPTNVSTNSQAKSGLADATFCWKVRAVDAHGNASAYSSVFEFTVDTTPPDVPDLSSPADGSTIGTDSPTLQWSDESPSGATNYDVLFVTKGASCDFTSQSPTNVSTNSQAKSGLADATFCWKVRAVDAHGNASAYSSTFEFTVDTTPPDVPDPSNPADGSTINSNPNFTWSSESASGA